MGGNSGELDGVLGRLRVVGPRGDAGEAPEMRQQRSVGGTRRLEGFEHFGWHFSEAVNG